MSAHTSTILLSGMALALLAAGCPGTRYKLGPAGAGNQQDTASSPGEPQDLASLATVDAVEARTEAHDISVANETWADEDLGGTEDTGPDCPPETPFVLAGGGCGECLADDHCIDLMECDLDDHTCGPPAVCDLCVEPYPQCAFVLEEKWACVSCLSDEDCGPNGHCNVDLYSCQGGVPAECDVCEPPYPACAQFNDVWSCVQCTDDSHCPNGGWCDLDLFICNGGDQPGCSGCTEDSQCEDLQGQLLCDDPTGCCYDGDGWCDGMNAHCHYAQGSECLPVLGPPDIPSELMLCSCTDPISLQQWQECLDTGQCPTSKECLGDLICVGGESMTIIPGQEDNGPFCIGPDLLALLPL
jgi:Cys-rich repeat protein